MIHAVLYDVRGAYIVYGWVERSGKGVNFLRIMRRRNKQKTKKTTGREKSRKREREGKIFQNCHQN